MSVNNTLAGYPPSINLVILLTRLAAGVIFLGHGAQKTFGLFGGQGLAGTVGQMGPLGYFVSIGEFFGGLALVVGLFSRFSAFWLIVIMVGAIVTAHGQNGLFLANKGFEYNLALIGLLAAPLISGPGAYACAQFLPPKLRRLVE